MDLNTFTKLYKDFLTESANKGWTTEVLIEDFGNYLASVKNADGLEVQFFIELDVENSVQLTDTTYQSKLNYGVLRRKGEGEQFAKDVLEAFHQYWKQRSSKRKATFILYKK